jgi:hypothetical protein
MSACWDAGARSKGHERLCDCTKADYLQQLAKIETAFGDLPLDAVTRDFLYWRGSNASKPAAR